MLGAIDKQEVALQDKPKDLGDFEIMADNKFKAEIYIETIEPFSGYGSGRYILNAVKELTGTEQYSALAQKREICQIRESVSECFARQFSMEVVSKCHCAPFDAFQAIDVKVGKNMK